MHALCYHKTAGIGIIAASSTHSTHAQPHNTTYTTHASQHRQTGMWRTRNKCTSLSPSLTEFHCRCRLDVRRPRFYIWLLLCCCCTLECVALLYVYIFVMLNACMHHSLKIFSFAHKITHPSCTLARHSKYLKFRCVRFVFNRVVLCWYTHACTMIAGPRWIACLGISIYVV